VKFEGARILEFGL